MMAGIDWDTGVVNAAFIYGPYGEILDSVGGELDTHLRRFNGKEADQLSRLSYYGFRYYDSLSLMWTQSDPLYRVAPDLAYDQPRRMSLYVFSLNNPLRYLDPDGRNPGDLKSSPIQAFLDFGKSYNDDSIRDGAEFATKIYKVEIPSIVLEGETFTAYSYGTPNRGVSDLSTGYGVQIPDGATVIGDGHTHGASSGEFDGTWLPSEVDEATAGDHSYLVNSAGVAIKIEKNGNHAVVGKGLPSDPNASDFPGYAPNSPTGPGKKDNPAFQSLASQFAKKTKKARPGLKQDIRSQQKERELPERRITSTNAR